MAFWDTSAIVALCVHQPAGGRIRGLLAEHRRLVVWWATPVEVRSALARLVRKESITQAGMSQALDRLAALRRSWSEVVPTDKVRNLADDFPERHALRAADALQLAAALVWCREKPRKRVFVCLDERLAAAAENTGFQVVP